jgi:hypothetical protein
MASFDRLSGTMPIVGVGLLPVILLNWQIGNGGRDRWNSVASVKDDRFWHRDRLANPSAIV